MTLANVLLIVALTTLDGASGGCRNRKQLHGD